MALHSTAARRYAEAAFEVALRDSSVDAWRRDLALVAEVLADPTVLRTMENPAIAMEVRSQLVDTALGPSISKPALNLVHLILAGGRLDMMGRVSAEFGRLDDRRQGITTATATSATPLAPTEVQALTARLEEMTGGRVELRLEVDPSLLGGLSVRVGDRLIDGSVRGRLERLRSQLVSGAL